MNHTLRVRCQCLESHMINRWEPITLTMFIADGSPLMDTIAGLCAPFTAFGSPPGCSDLPNSQSHRGELCKGTTLRRVRRRPPVPCILKRSSGIRGGASQIATVRALRCPRAQRLLHPVQSRRARSHRLRARHPARCHAFPYQSRQGPCLGLDVKIVCGQYTLYVGEPLLPHNKFFHEAPR